MNDFWANVSRYPRFFISSLVGLILVLIAPFQNLFQIKKFRFLIPIIFFISVILLYLILLNMTGL